MSTVKITGAREWEMTDDSTGRKFAGMTVYYDNPISSNDGRFGKGYASSKLKVQLGSDLHKRILAMDFTQPFEGMPVYDFVPGKGPVLSDIVF